MIPMNSSQVTAAAATDPNLTHDEIAQCARELWTESGQPEGRDEAIWFEAERRLVSELRAARAPAAVPQPAACPPSDTPIQSPRSRRTGRNQKYVM